jgi:Family of unknown function (DUF5906)
MSDDEDNIIRLNQLRSANFLGDRQQKRAERPPITNTKDSNEGIDKYHAIAIIVGKFMIIREDDVDGEIIFMTKKDFIDSLENERLQIIGEDGNPKSVPRTKLWLEWPLRRTYEKGIIFDPKYKFDSKVMRSGYYNTWCGFVTEPKKGECPLFLDYIKNIICSGDDKHYHWLMCWCAQIFQEPWNKLGTSLVLQGIKGIGKSYLAKILGMLMDGKPGSERRQRIALTIDNKMSIFGNHNDHMEKIILLCLEEAIWAGDKAHESTLKHYITGDTLFVNPKNLPGRTVKNYMRTIIIGNADWMVPASFDERRFFALNVSSAHKDDREYFDKLDEELLERGGLEALMYELMNIKIDVNLRTALVTEALIEQKTESMSGVERWWFNSLVSGQLPFIHQDERGYLVVKEKLYQNFSDNQKRLNDKNRIDQRSFGMRFVALMPKLDDNNRVQYYKNGKVISMVDGNDKYTSGNERLNIYIIPKLEICRKLMDFKLNSNFNWGNNNELWEYPTFTERNIMNSHNLF